MIIRFPTTSSFPRQLFSQTRHFHPSLSSPATVSADSDLVFPTKPHPTPLEIFHLDPSHPEQLTNVAIKSRFLALARKYHPDAVRRRQSNSEIGSSAKGKGKEIDTSEEFKQIVLAYELLKDPSKRSMYLRSGYGWTGPRKVPPGADPSSAYSFRRGNPMPSNRSWGNGAGSYSWDHGAANPDWTDPHNPHFRPSYSSSSTAGWTGQGTFSTNGTVFLILLSITTFLIPVSYWSALPAELLPRESFTKDDWDNHSQLIGGGRHAAAARNLERARREAKDGGMAKRDAIKKRVAQIERKRAYERALEVQRIERMGGTGHTQLALPPPSASPSSPK